jgi:hypothetical protein
MRLSSQGEQFIDYQWDKCLTCLLRSAFSEDELPRFLHLSESIICQDHDLLIYGKLLHVRTL